MQVEQLNLYRPQSAAREQSTHQVEKLIENAIKLHRAKDYELSFALIVNALQRDSFREESLIAFRDLQKQRKDLSKSIAAQQMIVKYQPDFENHVHLGELFYLNNQDEMALEAFEQAFEKMIFDSLRLFLAFKYMGNLAVKEGDFEGAEEFYNKAFALKPTDSSLHVNMGTLSLQKADLEAAKDNFATALELNSHEDKAWIGLSMVHLQKSDISLAEANLENALDLNPGNRTGVILYCSLLGKGVSCSKVKSRIEAYLDQNFQDEELTLRLIQLYCADGELTLALMECEKLLVLEPQRQDLLDLFNSIELRV